ncbi:Inherit from COG: Hemolysin-type calcium-binding [Seminavis robusta]|uniref:Inherit from COG: Hemolysin-type calcium-binding n=1 Tax=Seminavis robusta TaxID=568900 RepID=A0A9N8HS89_9STRA|nr:Inherit from COG: Hemolysin-type calcium-binding [Seminavis robusta]|eukprot:Sro1491_g277150.1 Inherit from COG: Hemolysin-type calcium-binding (815) ;mRNA; r:21059-24016
MQPFPTTGTTSTLLLSALLYLLGTATATTNAEAAGTGGQVSPFSTSHSRQSQLPVPLRMRKLQSETGWVQVGQQIEGAAAGDQSGYRVAINDDGTRIAIASPEYDGTNGAVTGLVRVYQYSVGTQQQWTPVGNALEGLEGEGIGEGMSLSGDGNTVAVGTFDLFPYDGSVLIFRFIGDQWVLLIELFGSSERDRFGGAISLNFDGTRIAIGAATHDGVVGDRRGQTQVWQQVGDAFTWEKETQIEGVLNGDRSGHAVALSGAGETVAIGEITADPNGLSSSGTVVIFRRIDSLSGWNQLGAEIAGVNAGDQNGYSVAISYDGNTVAAGAPYHSSQASQAGMVRVFAYDATANSNNGGWVQKGNTLYPTTAVASAKFGMSVSLSSDGLVLAVGEPNETGIGKTTIYQYNADFATWDLDTTLSKGSAADSFGGAVALSGDATHVIVGSHLADRTGAIDSGVTRVYQFTSSDWLLSVTSFQTDFGGGTDPEFALTFLGSAPTAVAGRTYRVNMFVPPCALEGTATDNAVSPVTSTGTIPNADTFNLVTQLRVDTGLLSTTGSDYYVDKGVGKGQLSFCLKMEVLEGTTVKVDRIADIVVQLDMGQGFLVENFVSRSGGSGKTDIREDVQFNYAFNTYFCDEFGSNIEGGTTTAVAPGGEVSVCLEAVTGQGVKVVDLKDVSFGNTQAPLLGVELINSAGTPILGTTTKECDATTGKCRVAALTIPRLYEYVDSSGTVQNVAAGVSMEGTVLFDFTSVRDRHLQGTSDPQTVEARFRVRLDLASPPDRSNRESSSSKRSFAVGFAGLLSVAFVSIFFV